MDNGMKSNEGLESPLKELFGILKSEKSAKEIVDEMRNDFESKWM